MSSAAEICSVALLMLGTAPINSLTQAAPRAEKCSAVYDIFRRNELASHNWKFAVAYVSLVAVDETPAFTYDYSYQLPADFLKVVRLDDGELDYRIVGDKLYTNANEVGLEYIRDVDDAGEFSQPFVDLLIARLAKDLAWSITNSRTIAVDMATNYAIVRRKSTGIDSQQGTPRKLYRNKMESARRL